MSRQVIGAAARPSERGTTAAKLVSRLRNLYYRSPESFQRAVLVLRRQSGWIRTGVVFIHVPKAAGTTISEALYGRFMGHVRASDLERWGSRAARSLPRFAIVRNPWDRVVSAYRFEKGWGGAGVPEFETFQTFLTRWLARRDVRKLNYVHQPQWQFVCDSEQKVLVDHVGRFEDLDATVSYLHGVVPHLPAIGHSNASGTAVDYRGFYTPELAELVGKIYADDIRLFGYGFDS
jgi:chondroitin 4-sulfotransferase 11